MRPVLTTERLVLRPMAEADIGTIVDLLGDLRVSGNTSNIPHPYTETDARDWVRRQPENRASGRHYVYAVTDPATDCYMGTVGLHWTDPQSEQDRASWEIGYVYGVPHWGKGYATEAGAAILREAEASLAPGLFTSRHFTENPKSGHVLVKLGFQSTGVIRDSFSVARGAEMPSRLMVRLPGTPLPDPGRLT